MTIRITLEPATAAGRYRAMLDGRLLVTSREPLYAAARVLLAEGVSPDEVLEAQHASSPIVAMRSTVGEAAKWTVEETDKGGMQRRKWRPFGSPRQDGPPGLEVAPDSAPEAKTGTRMGSEP